MKQIIVLIFLGFAALVSAQVRPDQTPVQLNPTNANWEFYSQKGGTSLRRCSVDSLGKNFRLSYYLGTSYVSATGNPSNLRNKLVRTPGDSVFLVDFYGNSFLVSVPGGGGGGSVQTLAPLTGNGSSGNKVRIDTAGVTAGKVLQFNGTAWVAANVSGTSGGGWVIQTGVPGDTTKTWIGTTDADGTGLRIVKNYISGAWRQTGYFDPVQKQYTNQEPFYMIVTGQSNCTPRSGPTSNPADTVPSTYQCIWNPLLSKWQRPFSTPWGWMNGITTKTAWHIMTMGQFAENEGRLTRIVYAARGGQTISNWITPGGTQWDTLSQRITASGIPRFDAIIWYQGETDGWTGRTQKQYTSDWFQVMRQLQALPQWQKNTRVFACQIQTGLVAGETLWPGEQPDGETANYTFNLFETDTADWTHVIRNNDAVVVSDSSHINAVSQVNLGKRMWNALSGRGEWKPFGDFQRYVARTADTVALNFLYSNYTIQKTTSATTIIQKLLGWQDGKNVSFIIEAPLAAKTVPLNSEVYCQNLLGDIVEIDTIFGSYAASGFMRNDSLILSQCPANYKDAKEYPITLSPYAWLDASKETKYTSGGAVDTLHDFSGNNRFFTRPSVGRGPTWVNGVLNGKAAFTFSPALADTSMAKWAIRQSSDFSFMHKDSATVFIITKVANTTPPTGSVCPIFGGTVGSAQLGYGLYFQQNAGNGVLVNLISNGSSLVVSNTNSVNGYGVTSFGLYGTFTDPENATAANRARMYVGANTYAANTQTNALSTTNKNAFLAARSNTGNFTFVGQICEILMFNKALTAAQISGLKVYYALKYNLSF